MDPATIASVGAIAAVVLTVLGIIGKVTGGLEWLYNKARKRPAEQAPPSAIAPPTTAPDLPQPDSPLSRALPLAVDNPEPPKRRGSTGPEAVYACLTKRVRVGDYLDFRSEGSDRERDLRITVKRLSLEDFPTWIGTQEKREAALLRFDLGGALIHGGKLAKHVDTNEFIVPLFRDDEPVDSVFAFWSDRKHFRFLAVRVEHIDMHGKELDIVVSFCRVPTSGIL